MLLLFFRLLRAEGPGSVARRLLDRARYRSWPSQALPTDARGRARPELRSPVLHLLATRPSPWWGGVEAQLVERRELECPRGPFALLFKEGRHFRLRVWRGKRRFTMLLAAAHLGAAVEDAAGLLGSEVLHIENLAGFDPAELQPLAHSGWPLVISMLDFAAFSPRPNLIEHPTLKFCGYSQDVSRCGRCLGVSPEVPAAWRRVAAELLGAATALVFPSEFALREHVRLFPGLDKKRLHVLPPVTSQRPMGPPRAGRSRPLRVAFLGNVQPHKGSRVFREVVAAFTSAERRELTFSAYGSGEPAELEVLRRLGVEIRGYFRLGSLPRILARDGIDIALLLSIFPETYCRVLDECREAGVPVLAFDFAALGERLRHHGGGWRVDPADGAAGVAATLRAILHGSEPQPPPPTLEPWPELDLAKLYERAREKRRL
jgi:glycosyltransferase involved in cell wall biosynthesis